MIERSKNIYSYPFQKEISIRAYKNSPAHTGPFSEAIDFLVPPETDILAPQNGVIAEVVDRFKKWGPTEKYKDYLNYLTISHENNEYSQVCHLAKDSARAKVGERVKKGQILATTGYSGWMTAPHLHLIVFRRARSKAGFKSLKIRFEKT